MEEDSEYRVGEGTYARGHLLPPLFMLLVVRLAEDIVLAILNASSVVVPVRALVARLVVDVDPDVGR